MKKILLQLCSALLVTWMLAAVPASAQPVAVVKFNQLHNILNSQQDTLYVVNFWATWCAPCIKELPEFEALHQQYAGKNLKVLLVSMDFKEDLDKKVKPFVAKRKLQSDVLLLDETDHNAFIDKIESGWSGAIPVTLVYNNARNFRKFVGKAFKEGELQALVNFYYQSN